MNKVTRIVGTDRQTVTTIDGSKVERMYVYLPAHVWHKLQATARSQGTSVSRIINAFATNGTANSKETNVSTRTRTN